MFKRVLLVAGLCGASFGTLRAQQAETAPAYSLKVSTRLVLEDVTVLDSKGNTVKGLPASAFHVTDQGTAETVLNFRETDSRADDGGGAPPPRATPGTFSNSELVHNKDTVVVLLIDPTTILLEDQMYLRVQALKFLDHTAENTPMVVFRVNRSGVPVLLQPLTRDKALVRVAVGGAVPTLMPPTGRAYSNAIAELQNIGDYLRNVPGRKAVLWLAGAFPLYQPPDFGAQCAYRSGATCGTRQNNGEGGAYRALEQARAAVYPIDVRGVQMGGMTMVKVVNRSSSATAAGTSAGESKPTSESEKVAGQYDEMDLLAKATGGKAFYSNNDVAGMLDHAVQLTTVGYALTYRPHDEPADGKWHVVRIRVDGPYTAHYREGYFASGGVAANDDAGHRASKAGETAGGTPGAAHEEGERDRPLVFSAHVVAERPAGKSGMVNVRYVIAQDQLSFDGATAGHARFRLAALAYDENGNVLSQAMEIIDTRYTDEQKKLAGRIGTPADQTIEVKKGARYLLLAVEDLQTKRVGVVQLPLRQAEQETK